MRIRDWYGEGAEKKKTFRQSTFGEELAQGYGGKPTSTSPHKHKRERDKSRRSEYLSPRSNFSNTNKDLNPGLRIPTGDNSWVQIAIKIMRRFEEQ